jgi:hypothetical protein
MNESDLLKRGFICEDQYKAARHALDSHAAPHGNITGFSVNGWAKKPIVNADYSKLCYSKTASAPVEFDLTPEMPPVYDQGARGTCVANAVTAMVEYYYNNQYKLSRQFFYWALKKFDGSEERLQKWLSDPLADEDFLTYEKEKRINLFHAIKSGSFHSRYLEFVKRSDEGKFYVDEDGNLIVTAAWIEYIKQKYRKSFSGATLDVAYHVLRKYGICRDELLEYVPVERFETEAHSLADDLALEKEIMREKLQDASRRIPETVEIVSGQSVDTLKRIVSGQGGKRPMPVVIAVQLFQSLWSDYTKETGWFSLPFDDDEMTGGHAMLVTGYKDVPYVPGGGYFIVRNSWNTSWAWNYKDNAHRGYARIPYAYIENYGYPQAVAIIATPEASDGGSPWPPKKDKILKYIQQAPRMMKNRKGLFNIGKGDSIIVDPETGKADKDTPENRKIFIENGYSWDPVPGQNGGL